MPSGRSLSGHLRGLALVATLALPLAGACAHFQPAEGDTAVAAPRAQVVFINESLEQADVYALSPGGESVRIGTVMPGRTATLELPPQFVTRGSVNVAARLVGRSAVVRTGPVSISPGDRIQVRLPLNANILSVLPGG